MAAASVLDSIRRLVQMLRTSGNVAVNRFGISGAQLYVLRQLSAAARPLSVNELAQQTWTDQSSVSVVVKRLESRRLIRRSRSTKDSRRWEISLAPAARVMLKKAPETAQESLIAALESMPRSRRNKLAELMREFAQSASHTSDAAPMFFEEAERHTGKDRKIASS